MLLFDDTTVPTSKFLELGFYDGVVNSKGSYKTTEPDVDELLKSRVVDGWQ